MERRMSYGQQLDNANIVKFYSEIIYIDEKIDAYN